MSPRHRDDTARFMEALVALSHAEESVTDKGRYLPLSESDPMQAVMREINETVLRRTVSFCAEDGRRLGLEVAERRILAVSAMPDEEADAYADLVARPLAPADIARLDEVLRRFCRPPCALYVRSDPAKKSDVPEFGGLSLGDIAAAVEQPVAEEAEFSDNGLTEATKALADWGLLRDTGGAVLIQWGEVPEAFAALPISSMAATLDEGRLSAFQIDENTMLVVVWIEKRLGMFGCSLCAAPACFALWHDAITRRTSGDQAA